MVAGANIDWWHRSSVYCKTFSYGLFVFSLFFFCRNGLFYFDWILTLIEIWNEHLNKLWIALFSLFLPPLCDWFFSVCSAGQHKRSLWVLYSLPIKKWKEKPFVCTVIYIIFHHLVDFDILFSFPRMHFVQLLFFANLQVLFYLLTTDFIPVLLCAAN